MGQGEVKYGDPTSSYSARIENVEFIAGSAIPIIHSLEQKHVFAFVFDNATDENEPITKLRLVDVDKCEITTARTFTGTVIVSG